MASSKKMTSPTFKEHRIAVLGMGHVGLPTALGFAELGWEVIGADDDVAKIALLQQQHLPFFEPDLQALLSKHLASGRFIASTDVEEAIRSASILFVCVGTPQRENGEADLSQVETIARIIARNLNGYKLIIEKSTVPAITAQWIKRTINRYARPFSKNGASTPNVNRNGNGGGGSVDLEHLLHFSPDSGLMPVVNGSESRGLQCGSGAEAFLPEEAIDFDVASNPEFLQEGTAVVDFFKPDRIVVGVESERARKIVETLYRPFHAPVLVTKLSTAELIKHAANAFLATKISFINMVSDLCEAVGADVSEVADGLGLDPRIGRDFLNAGIGFGGYCLPKDLRSLIYLAEEHSVDSSLLRAIEALNQSRVESLIKKLRQALWILKGKTIGVLGVAFKPGTDDIREAPALRVITALLEAGCNLRVFDPKAIPQCEMAIPPKSGRLLYCNSAYEAAQSAHALVILTEWKEFRALDFDRIREQMEVPIIVDGRNCLDPEQVSAGGIEYICFGRERVQQHTVSTSRQPA